MPWRRRQQELAQVETGLTVIREPARVEHAAVEYVRGRDGTRRRITQPHTSAGHKVSGTRKAQVAGNELRMWNAVAIREDQILGRRFDDGAIEDAAFAKADVFLPHVPDVEVPRLASTLNAGARLVAGTVVGDDDLESSKGLSRIPREHPLQIERAVVGGEHHADGRSGTGFQRSGLGEIHAAISPAECFGSATVLCRNSDAARTR